MKLQGRKFLGMILGVLLLLLIIILILVFAKEAITSEMLIVYGVLITFLIVSFIGGNVFKSFVTSKYFHSELLNKDKGNEE